MPATATPTETAATAAERPVHRHEVVIVGTGFSGLGMAIKLLEDGVRDIVLLERGDDVGGTWRDNTYPGAACDVPSHLYSFSFAPNPDWSRSFSEQPEILAYLQKVAREHGVYEHCRFGVTAQAGRWDAERSVWTVETTDGTYEGRVLVAAAGGLSEPKTPPIPGIEDFQGQIFHSAKWEHASDLEGKRVAVVGTGASAIQIVPWMRRHAAELHLFQRTPPWIVPRTDRPFTRVEKVLMKRVPAFQKAVRGGIYWARELYVFGFAKNRRVMALPQRIAEAHLTRGVKDPELREKLRPDYQIGCKRILISNDYYPALDAPTSTVHTGGLTEVRDGRTLVSGDGTEAEVDAIIMATGFEATEPPIASGIVGADGRTLAETWNGTMEAYLGTSVAGFPNMFFLVGPNVGLGHSSMVYMIESQVQYVRDAIATMRREGLASVDVTPEAQRDYNAGLQSSMRQTIWMEGGCASWYLSADGTNRTLWPDFTFRFRERTKRFHRDAYRVQREAAPVGVRAG